MSSSFTKSPLTVLGQGQSPPLLKTIHPADVVKDISYKDIAGTRVLFINMPLRESAPPVDAPQGPLLMATNLRQNYGVDVTIVDLNAYRIKDEDAQKRELPDGRHLTYREAREHIALHLKKFGIPILVGFSGKITTFRWQQEIAKIIREFLPDVFLVSGNGLATELKTGLFGEMYIPELDGVCSSDGDEVILKMVYDAKLMREVGMQSAISSGRLEPYCLGQINGRLRFWYKGYRPHNLDAFPFADMDILTTDVYGNRIRDQYLYLPSYGSKTNSSTVTPWEDDEITPKTNSVSSRGCPFGCHYCLRGADGARDWAVRSAEHIFDELTHNQERYGIKFHCFHDDNFAVRADRIAGMVPLLGPLGIKWGCLTRLDEAAGLNPSTGKFENPLRIELMARAGCVFIGFGPESASPDVLKAIGKGGHTLTNGMMEVLIGGRPFSFPRSMVEGIRNAWRFGIHSNCTWIVGSPTERLADVKTSVRFIQWQIQECGKAGIQESAINQKMFTMTWYPGTQLVNDEQVRRSLSRAFNISFVPAQPNTAGVNWEPVLNEHFRHYLIELDDATKVLHHPKTGEPVNFSEMPTDLFLKVRERIDSNDLFGILDL